MKQPINTPDRTCFSWDVNMIDSHGTHFVEVWKLAANTRCTAARSWHTAPRFVASGWRKDILEVTSGPSKVSQGPGRTVAWMDSAY